MWKYHWDPLERRVSGIGSGTMNGDNWRLAVGLLSCRTAVCRQPTTCRRSDGRAAIPNPDRLLSPIAVAQPAAPDVVGWWEAEVRLASGSID